jgi:hypothetical protein
MIMAKFTSDQLKQIWDLLSKKELTLKEIRAEISHSAKNLGKDSIISGLVAHMSDNGKSAEDLTKRCNNIKSNTAGGAKISKPKFSEKTGIHVSIAKFNAFPYDFDHGQKFDLNISNKGVITLKMTDED